MVINHLQSWDDPPSKDTKKACHSTELEKFNTFRSPVFIIHGTHDAEAISPTAHT